MNNIFNIFIISVLLLSCTDKRKKVSKEIDLIKEKPFQYYVSLKNLDTTIEIFRYPESLMISKDSLIIQIRQYESKYDFKIIDSVFFIKNLIKKDNIKGQIRQIYFPFNIDSSKYEDFTSVIHSTKVDLSKYSFFPNAMVFYNEPRKYRCGPTYFRLKNNKGDIIQFDGETIESIEFISKISPTEYIMIFNSYIHYLKGYNFSIGVLNTESLKQIQS